MQPLVSASLSKDRQNYLICEHLLVCEHELGTHEATGTPSCKHVHAGLRHCYFGVRTSNGNRIVQNSQSHWTLKLPCKASIFQFNRPR